MKFPQCLIRGAIATIIGGSLIPLGSLPPLQAQEARTTFLASGESEIYEGYFLEGEAIFAICDDDCEDIDLVLYDAFTGDMVEADLLLDPEPRIVAPYEGEFLVEVIMVTCNANTCETQTTSDYGF